MIAGPSTVARASLTTGSSCLGDPASGGPSPGGHSGLLLLGIVLIVITGGMSRYNGSWIGPTWVVLGLSSWRRAWYRSFCLESRLASLEC